MPKSSLKQVKKDELKIIRELKKNANQSINDIAKKCGFSRQKVWRAIKNLEKNDIIWGYTAIVDDLKLDRKKYFILIKRASKPLTDMIDKIILRVLKEKSEELDIEIITGTLTNGTYDFICCFNAPDIINAKRFLENLNKVFGSMISKIDLIEELFCIQNCGIENPNREQLKEFF